MDMTPDQKLAIDYLYKHIMETDVPNYPMTQEQKQDNWDRMPEDQKLLMADLILGWSQKGHPAFVEILEQRKKNHSDMSFGMICKSILAKYKC